MVTSVNGASTGCLTSGTGSFTVVSIKNTNIDIDTASIVSIAPADQAPTRTNPAGAAPPAVANACVPVSGPARLRFPSGDRRL
jgi:hypothetical protein